MEIVFRCLHLDATWIELSQIDVLVFQLSDLNKWLSLLEKPCRFRKDISNAELSLDRVLDIVSVMLSVKAAQVRTSQRPDGDELSWQ